MRASTVLAVALGLCIAAVCVVASRGGAAAMSRDEREQRLREFVSQWRDEPDVAPRGGEATEARLLALAKAGFWCENSTTGWSPAPPSQVVDIRIGSGGDGYGCANFPPGAQVPFGAMRISPDTSIDWLRIPWRHGGGYSWCDTHVRGFSHTHMVAPGVDDLGNIGVMPFTGPATDKDLTCFNPLFFVPSVDIRICNYRQPFVHPQETMAPGHYSTVLLPQEDDSKQQKTNWTIRAEFTATGTAAFHRYEWVCPDGEVCSDAATARRQIIVNVCHMVSYTPKACVAGGVSIDAATNTVTGTVHNDAAYSRRFGGFTVYFAARFVDAEIDASASGTWSNGHFAAGAMSSANLTDDGGALLDFGTIAGAASQNVTMRIALSYISYDVALQNLALDIPDDRTFESVVESAQALWDHNIHGLITINSGGSADDALKLRTALYHATMAPTNYTEAGGQFLGFDNKVHNANGLFAMHSDMSIWDIMRTQFPLLSFLLPDRAYHVMQSMLTVADQTGLLPKWILVNGETGGMQACHSVVMLSDGLTAGVVDNINVTDVLMKFNHTLRTRQGPAYLARGYNTDSPCETQEYSLDDFCTAGLAAKLGNSELQQSFEATANYWENVFDAQSQFFCARNATGGVEQCRGPEWDWEALFVFDKHYTEGDAWHWRWFAPHAMPSLVTKMGGADAYAKLFDEFMYKSRDYGSNILPNGWYWSGNEPDIQSPYTAHYAGRPDLVQKYVRWLMEVKYHTRPDGIPGNDDYGTMSSWFVWSALGIFPLSCQGMFATGSPLFESVTVHRPAYGSSIAPCELTINAYNNSATNIYVSRVVLNGVPVTSGFIPINDLLNGGAESSLLEFFMTDQPTKYY